MPTTTRRLRLAIAAAALLAAASSCSQTPGDGAAPGAKPGQDGGPIDACAQIPPAEVAGLLGPNVPGKPAVEGGDTSCVWENPDTNHSITLEIGAAATAPGGRLPAPDPAQSAQPIPNADGMLLVGTDQVEFAAGDRLCFLQVLTDEAQRDKDRETAIRLARDIRGRL